MNVEEEGSGSMNWINVAQDRNRWRAFCECDNEPTRSIE